MLQDERVDVASTWTQENRVERHREIDRALRRVAKTRAGLDVEEARWLREAERLRIWRKLGFSTALEYLEDVFGYAPRTAPDELVFAREGKLLVDARAPREATVVDSLKRHTAPRSLLADVAKLVHAKAALRQLGFRGRAVGEILERACAEVGPDADVSKLVQTALALSRGDDPKHAEASGRELCSLAVRALVQLGFPRVIATAAVEKSCAHVDDQDLAMLIKAALHECSSS